MPTPLEILLQPVSLAFLAIYASLMLWEAIAPARPMPYVKGWWWRALLVFASYFLLSSYLPMWWAPYLLPYQLLDLSSLGPWLGGLVGLLVYQSVAYAWHRSIHAFTPMWRGFHQMHHSAERLDTTSAFWFSPLESIGWTAVASVALMGVVGLSAQATTVTLLTASALAIFTHTNVRTPRWLGYLVERPESHALHHARGHHRDNYSELPFIDMLFGTFRNPAGFAPENGFYDGASQRVVEMSLGRDVSSPRVVGSMQRT